MGVRSPEPRGARWSASGGRVRESWAGVPGRRWVTWPAACRCPATPAEFPAQPTSGPLPLGSVPALPPAQRLSEAEAHGGLLPLLGPKSGCFCASFLPVNLPARWPSPEKCPVRLLTVTVGTGSTGPASPPPSLPCCSPPCGPVGPVGDEARCWQAAGSSAECGPPGSRPSCSPPRPLFPGVCASLGDTDLPSHGAARCQCCFSG